MLRGLLVSCILFLVSCSTTKLLDEGAYRLASTKIEIEGETDLNPSELMPYLRQQPNKNLLFGWNPFLNVYNWSNGSGKGINAIWEKLGTAPVVYDESLTRSSVENIRARLEYLGYYDSKVTPELTTVRKLAKLNYKIEPGYRFTIDEVLYDIPEGEFAEDFYKDTSSVSIKAGDYLSESALEAETQRGTNYFRNLGYYTLNKNNYSFEADTLLGHTVLNYRIRSQAQNESPLNKYYINNVNIHYPSDLEIRESLLLKLNRIFPSELYREATVNTTYHRLSALNIFNSVNIEMFPSDSNRVDCDIRLRDSNIFGFKVNAEASTNSSGLFGISPQLSFFHKNLFKGAERLSLDFSGNWQFMPGSSVSSTELGVSANLSFPRPLGYPLEKARGRNIPRTEFIASFNYQNRPEYRRNVAGFSVGYSGQIRNRIFFQIYPVQLNLVKLYDISEYFSLTLAENPYLWDSFQDQIDAGIGMTLYYTTDSAIIPTSSYSFARLSLDLSGNMISLFNNLMPTDDSGQKILFGLPYNQYLRTQLQLGKTFRYGGNEGQAIAMRLDMGFGYVYGNSTALPFEKQFYAGGASSMRGWQARSLGPGFSSMDYSFVIPSQTGDVKLEFDLEYRFDMFWKVEGAVFAEAGNVWIMDEMYDFFASLAADWGLGVRLNLSFILLRLDMGFKVRDPSRETNSRWLRPSQWTSSDGYAVHFGVGYPF